MEALLFQAVYLFRRTLPWTNFKPEEKERRGTMKSTIKPESLTRGMPRQFAKYLEVVRNLEFEERPPYAKLIGLMINCLHAMGIDEDEDWYDWDRKHVPLPIDLRR